MGCFQFTDLSPELTPFQRRYVSFVKRCDEIERKVRYITGEAKKMGVPLQSAGSVEGFVEASQNTEGASGSYLLESIESKLDVYEQQLLELNKYSDKLTDEYSHKVRGGGRKTGWVSVPRYQIGRVDVLCTWCSRHVSVALHVLVV
jgi:V-type H+-transporting ATPase subunit a